jgi:hypothetical protein
VDLLVIPARAGDEEPLRAALLDAVRPVEVRFRLAVHPVVMTAADLAARRDDPLVAAIAADGLVLSGRAPKLIQRVRALASPRPRVAASPAAEAGDTARASARARR